MKPYLPEAIAVVFAVIAGVFWLAALALWRFADEESTAIAIIAAMGCSLICGFATIWAVTV